MANHSKPNNIILECVTGSQMYNLATPESDTDIKGVFILPKEEFLGLKEPELTYDHVNPDYQYHELGKFMHLASKMNPTITELLWANDYLILNDLGKKLVDNRKLFLSNIAFKTYYGYALSQLRKNYRNGSNITNYRFGKHARHIFRLLMQGEQLLTTGELRVECTEEEREYIFSFMEMTQDEVFNAFEEKAKHFNSIHSILPDKPDFEKLNDLCLEIRKEYDLNIERGFNL